MCKKSLIGPILTGIFLLNVIVAPSPAVAQQSNGLNITLSPTTLELKANPGETISQKFRIRNNDSVSTNLKVSVDKLSPRSENGQVVPVAPQAGDTSTTWISFDEQAFTAPAKEWKDVGFSIKIPADAAFSYAYAIRVSQNIEDTSTQQPAAKIIGEIVMPVLLTVKSPTATASLQMESFAPKVFINEYLPVTLELKLRNTGNVYLKPQGNIFIRTGKEQDVTALEINPGSSAILPDGTRTLTAQWNDGFMVREQVMENNEVKMDINGKPVSQIKIYWDRLTHFRIGKYTAEVLAVYDDGTRDVPLQASTTFIVFPYKLIGGILLSVILFIATIRQSMKWYVAREVKKAHPTPDHEKG